MSSCVGHMTTETVFGQTLALWLGNKDEHRALESDTTGLNAKGNLYFYLLVWQFDPSKHLYTAISFKYCLLIDVSHLLKEKGRVQINK